MVIKKLTQDEINIIENKATEAPFSGEYWNNNQYGDYFCKKCNAHLFNSNHQFASQCGWPSFDDEIDGSVEKIPDADGIRTEIICKNCKGHLGHIFHGEHLTIKNQRYCVNSLSLNFKLFEINDELDIAYFAAGCFWGVEYYLNQLKGVKKVISGFMDGFIKNPSYEQVVYENTKHIETVKVIYNPKIITYEDLTKYFFEIHDPTQANGQGPDIGYQYKSMIFTNNSKEAEIAKKLIKILTEASYDIVTEVKNASEFYAAELYHQNYYQKNGKSPYCHSYKKKF